MSERLFELFEEIHPLFDEELCRIADRCRPLPPDVCFETALRHAVLPAMLYVVAWHAAILHAGKRAGGSSALHNRLELEGATDEERAEAQMLVMQTFAQFVRVLREAVDGATI